MASSGSTYIPWSKVTETVPQKSSGAYVFLRIFVQTNEIKGFGGRLWQEVLHVRELRVRPAQTLRQGPSKGTTKHYQSLSLSDLVITSNMIWGKAPPPLCDFVQWLDTKQSQQDKDHVERQARWAAQR